MSRHSFILFFSLGLSALCWSSCTGDADLNPTTIIGRWDIESATRNGRPTESLVSLYMVFEADGSFETNLSGTPEIGRYLLEEELIKTQDVSLAMDYELALLTDSTMQLKSTYRNYRLDFSFLRVIDLEKEETSNP